jgi:hypothetical protein
MVSGVSQLSALFHLALTHTQRQVRRHCLFLSIPRLLDKSKLPTKLFLIDQRYLRHMSHLFACININNSTNKARKHVITAQNDLRYRFLPHKNQFDLIIDWSRTVAWEVVSAKARSLENIYANCQNIMHHLM